MTHEPFYAKIKRKIINNTFQLLLKELVDEQIFCFFSLVAERFWYSSTNSALDWKRMLTKKHSRIGRNIGVKKEGRKEFIISQKTREFHFMIGIFGRFSKICRYISHIWYSTQTREICQLQMNNNWTWAIYINSWIHF